MRVLHGTCICKSHAAPACMRVCVRSVACLGRTRTARTRAYATRVLHVAGICKPRTTRAGMRGPRPASAGRRQHERDMTRVLQASQQDRAEADEAPIPARRGRACCGRAEPRSRRPSGGRASTARNESGMADSSPRQLTAPLMSLCTKMGKTRSAHLCAKHSRTALLMRAIPPSGPTVQ